MTWDIPALAKSVVDGVIKLIPDRDMQLKMEGQRTQMQHDMELRLLDAQNQQLNNQAEINKIEAASPSVFVGGWRPFIGWICGAGLAWEFVLAQVVKWSAALFGSDVVLPDIASDHLFELVLAMLGLAGWRTLDKIKHVDTTQVQVRKATRP